MAYMALYRKHRSKTFDEILGQDHITKTLKNQIMNNKIAHAYLFCGIRGTGKTSIAKILAKAVNCENPENGNPCLTCKTCQDIQNDAILNVIEIDAASNTGVDDVRNIRDDALYMPASGKYKVYIIDEVHMLSKSAFNALLKILEEPPKHVIFILATTESQKIPQTILSRCQRFDLKRISKDLMKERMLEYVKEEGVQIEERAIEYIVELSEGSMRDGLSILEQVISIKEGEEITFDELLDVLGNVDYDTYNKFTLALNNKDIKTCVEIINNIYDDGKDIVNFTSMYATYLRNLVLIASNTNVDILDMSKENYEKLQDIAKTLKLRKLISLLEKFVNVEKEMKYSSMPKLTLEMLIIALSNADETVQVAQSNSNQVVPEEAPKKIVKPRISNMVETIKEGDIDAYIEAWNALVDQVTDIPTKTKLNKVKINQLIGNKVFMTAEFDYVVDYVLNYKERLEARLPKTNGEVIDINIAKEEIIEEAKKKNEQNKGLDDSDLDSLTKKLAKTGIDYDFK